MPWRPPDKRRTAAPGQLFDLVAVFLQSLAQLLAVFLAGMRIGVLSASDEYTCILPPQPLDFSTLIRKNHFAGSRPRYNLAFDADACGGLGQLAANACLQFKQVVQFVVREDAAQVDVLVGAAYTIHAAVPLHQAHRVTGQVEIDDVSALLKIHALR